jgi:hypothetical protein
MEMDSVPLKSPHRALPRLGLLNGFDGVDPVTPVLFPLGPLPDPKNTDNNHDEKAHDRQGHRTAQHRRTAGSLGVAGFLHPPNLPWDLGQTMSILDPPAIRAHRPERIASIPIPIPTPTVQRLQQLGGTG